MNTLIGRMMKAASRLAARTLVVWLETISAAATTALASVFGDDTPFAMTTLDPAAVVKTRSYPSFSAASDEVNDSRVYAGIHFRSAVVDGQALGRGIANAMVASAFGRAR